MRALENHAAFVRSGLRERYEARGAVDVRNINRFLSQVVSRGLIDLDEEDVGFLIALYDNEIRFVDAAFCRLMKKLDHPGLQDDTVIILTSDHGEELMERGHVHHGTLHDEVVRVPLIVRVPGMPPARSRKLVQSIDVPPTILRALGLSPDAQFVGRSMLPVGAPGHAFVTAEDRGRAMLRTETKKLLVQPDGITLYDLAVDPGESTNVATKHVDTVREMQRLLLDALQRTDGNQPERADVLGEGEHARLRAFGYLD